MKMNYILKKQGLKPVGTGVQYMQSIFNSISFISPIGGSPVSAFDPSVTCKHKTHVCTGAKEAVGD